MINRFFLLFWFRIKAAFSMLPRITGATLVFAMLTAFIGWAGTQLLYRNPDRTHMQIAIVLPEDGQQYSRSVFLFLNEIDTVSQYCSFNEMDKEAAFAGLKNGSVYAVILVPDNFVDHIMNGTNTPAQIILPKGGKTTSSPLFRELVNAGVGDLAVAQAGIYAVDDVYVKYGLRNEIAGAELYLNETYLSYTLNRSIYFEDETISATGSLTLPQFYTRTAIVLLFMLSGIACSTLIGRSSTDSAFTLSLQRLRIPAYMSQISKTISVSLVYYVITLSALAVVRIISAFSAEFAKLCNMLKVSLDIRQLLLLFLGIYCIFSLSQTILTVSENISVNAILLFLLTLIMMFVSGSIIPQAFLPHAVRVVSNYIPTTWILMLWGDIINNIFNWSTLLINILICCICTALQTFLLKINS